VTAGRPGFGKSFTVARKRWQLASGVALPPTRGLVRPGGGGETYMTPPPMFRGTTMQTCGFWPWVVGSPAPLNAVPLGADTRTGTAVCADPISYFNGGRGIIQNPSLFVLGLPGFGKSSLIARMIVGLFAFGALPMVLGDIRPDYVELVRALGGQVISLGPGAGSINVLDASEAQRAAQRLPLEEREALLAEWHERRVTLVAALVTIGRRTPPSDREEHLISAAIALLDERHEGTPTLHDLIALIEQAPDALRVIAMDRGDDQRYRDQVENLLASLRALVGDPKSGSVFGRQTSDPIRRDRPVVVDISGVSDSAKGLQAAILSACWGVGLGLIELSQALADRGLEPRRHYLAVIDELHRALRVSKGMVERIDLLTRLNRKQAVGLVLCTHTMADLEILPDEEDRKAARGFVERCGMVALAALPQREIPYLGEVVHLSHAEQELLHQWRTPESWSSELISGEPGDEDQVPHGLGKFLLKVGDRPGLPVQVTLRSIERQLHDTNKRWHERERPQSAREAVT
jgi:hypothetical protein